MRFVLSCAAARIKHRCGVGWSAEGGASLADRLVDLIEAPRGDPGDDAL